MGGLGVSWVVAGFLVRPQRCELGEPPGDLMVVKFSVSSESGSSLAGWTLAGETGHGVVVLLHGIRGNRLSMLGRARELHCRGISVVMIDFQSHGESPGQNITLGHLEKHDADASVEFARRTYPGEKVGVIGVSLGGASALLASPLNLDAIVLESVYPNIEDAISNRVESVIGPLAPFPSALLLWQLYPRLGIRPAQLRPIDRIGETECPTFVVSGKLDTHTTAVETEAMFAAAKEPKQLWLVDGGAHVDLYEYDPVAYRDRVIGFIERHVASSAPPELTP
ncbi:Alpha/beta hydrolase family protein [Rubripirellula tenax]|uniref:Alpha/beta hydrolase family protein n=2 Tax=Rubripirellula tenax TaxID=2528015 RepID=A0A5C6FDE8_9BACT|nr:Alpha/beta hydrolase family protein [Rubripirellula tenax]